MSMLVSPGKSKSNEVNSSSASSSANGTPRAKSGVKSVSKTTPRANAAVIENYFDPKVKTNEVKEESSSMQVEVTRIPPVKKLTVFLIKTYREVNQKYYERKAKRQAEEAARQASLGAGRGGKQNNGWDDENYDLLIQPNDVIQDHYRIVSVLGKGSFGIVAKAEDMRHPEGNEWVAIKIIKSKRPFFEQARTEISVLTLLNQRDPNDERGIVRMLENFVYKNHQCIVFQLLSYNLYDLIKDTRFHGISLHHVRRFAKQLFDSLDFLLPPATTGTPISVSSDTMVTSSIPAITDPNVGVIHCDLKPENILLRFPKRSAIKVIDFGSSCFTNERMYSYIQSRFYRAPEILLGLQYSHPIDMWSLGCILVELHTGEPIFSGSDEVDQVYHQVAVLGMPPAWMLEGGKKSKNTFKKHVISSIDAAGTQIERVEWVLRDRKNQNGQAIAMPRRRTLRSILGVENGGPHGNKSGTEQEGHSIVDYLRFEDLIRKLLDWNPETRLTPAEALLHPFFKTCNQVSTDTSDLATSSVYNNLSPSLNILSRNESPVAAFLLSISNLSALPLVYQKLLTDIGNAISNGQIVDPNLVSSLPPEHQYLVEQFQNQMSIRLNSTDNMMVEHGQFQQDASQQCDLDKVCAK